MAVRAAGTASVPARHAAEHYGQMLPAVVPAASLHHVQACKESCAVLESTKETAGVVVLEIVVVVVDAATVSAVGNAEAGVIARKKGIEMKDMTLHQLERM